MLVSKTPGTKRSSSGTILKTTWGARIALLTLVALLAAGLPLADGNKRHKLSSDHDALKGGHSGATVDVIVQYDVPPTDAHHQKVRSKGGF